MLRSAEVVIAFGELKKGTIFDYDDVEDAKILSLIEIGVVKDLGAHEVAEVPVEVPVEKPVKK